jgi:hypothetical protein
MYFRLILTAIALLIPPLSVAGADLPIRMESALAPDAVEMKLKNYSAGSNRGISLFVGCQGSLPHTACCVTVAS